jgi:diphosphomevalonate decarboxylase
MYTKKRSLHSMQWTATAVASPNIALIKYWGNRDHELRIPSNGSISMTLGGLETRTSVTFDPSLKDDELFLNGMRVVNAPLIRVKKHLDHIRIMAGIEMKSSVRSESNFPVGIGIASSAAGFAALTLAASSAAGLDLTSLELSRLARLGSGSACRSIFGGFVEWHPGNGDDDSYAEPIADPDHWNLVDLIAIVEESHKAIGSTSGHKLASSSPVQNARVVDADRRLSICRTAILERDFSSLAPVIEQDSNLMHAVMMTSIPPLLYWLPETIAIMQAVIEWRQSGLDVCYTIDAGPNVHCICTEKSSNEVEHLLATFPNLIRMIRSPVGHAPFLQSAG